MFELVVICVAIIIALIVVKDGGYTDNPARPITPTRKGDKNAT